jgi:hypothetical protein
MEDTMNVNGILMGKLLGKDLLEGRVRDGMITLQ